MVGVPDSDDEWRGGGEGGGGGGGGRGGGGGVRSEAGGRIRGRFGGGIGGGGSWSRNLEPEPLADRKGGCFASVDEVPPRWKIFNAAKAGRSGEC